VVRARHFVDRAAAMAYDEHGQTAPAAYAASMLLFTAVTDTVERSPEGDSSWLDAAVEALSSNDGWGQSEMRHTLLVVRQDYVIEPSESRTIGDAAAAVPERTELRDANLVPNEIAAAVTSVPKSCRSTARRSRVQMTPQRLNIPSFGTRLSPKAHPMWLGAPFRIAAGGRLDDGPRVTLTI
jgi:hypothetical protein